MHISTGIENKLQLRKYHKSYFQNAPQNFHFSPPMPVPRRVSVAHPYTPLQPYIGRPHPLSPGQDHTDRLAGPSATIGRVSTAATWVIRRTGREESAPTGCSLKRSILYKGIQHPVNARRTGGLIGRGVNQVTQRSRVRDSPCPREKEKKWNREWLFEFKTV